MNDKSKLEKRLKWLQIYIALGIILVISHLMQLIFYTQDNFRIFMNGLQSILFMIITINYWFQFKKAKEQLQNQT